MTSYTRGDPLGFYYKFNHGQDDRTKTEVNQLVVSEGRCKFDHKDSLNSLGSWVSEDPLSYCASEWHTLISRMASKVRTANDDALIMADLFYAKDTLDVAVVYAKKALQIARALKKRDIMTIKYYFSKYNSEYGVNRKGRRVYHRALTELPEAWLTMSFVVNPLMSTFKAFSDVVDNPLIWREVVFSAGSFTNTYKKNWGYWGDQRLERYTIKSTGKGYCRFTNPNQHLIHRLGLTDVVGTIWDIIPWSWAVDYFFNISDYIAQMNPRYDQIEWERSYYGLKINRSTMLEFNQYHKPDWLPNYYNGSSYHRFPGIPGALVFQAQLDLTLDQFANLSSALALTLANKFAMRRT